MVIWIQFNKTSLDFYMFQISHTCQFRISKYQNIYAEDFSQHNCTQMWQHRFCGKKSCKKQKELDRFINYRPYTTYMKNKASYAICVLTNPNFTLHNLSVYDKPKVYTAWFIHLNTQTNRATGQKTTRLSTTNLGTLAAMR